jgi:hypothetical protein
MSQQQQSNHLTITTAKLNVTARPSSIKETGPATHNCLLPAAENAQHVQQPND